MQILLDTHTFLWSAQNSAALSPQARQLICDIDNEIFLSAASAWEIAIKSSKGKLKIAKKLEDFINDQIRDSEFLWLSLKLSHLAFVETLPFHHGDPFDRILASQALVENMTLLSCDQIFDSYKVRRMW